MLDIPFSASLDREGTGKHLARHSPGCERPGFWCSPCSWPSQWLWVSGIRTVSLRFPECDMWRTDPSTLPVFVYGPQSETQL